MKARHFFKELHLWLGLISGIVVFIMAITGCLFSFSDEIEAIGTPALSVSNGGKLLDPETLKTKVEQQIRVTPADSLNTVGGITYGAKGKPATASCRMKGRGFMQLTIDPYTGKITHYPVGRKFFRFVIQGHRSLWLPHAIGGPIIAWAIVIFVIELITGIVLWFPRKKWTRNSVRSRLLIKWRTNASTRLYSLHNTPGGYVLIFAFLIAFTGLTWCFSSLSKVYYAALTGKEFQEWNSPQSDTTAVAKGNTSMRLWEKVQRIYPVGQKGTVQFSFPDEKADVYTITYNPDPDKRYTSESRFYDRYTLKEIPGGGTYGLPNSQLSAGDKIFRMSYDIHSGSIAGLPGKIFACLISFIVATLPVTGFLMWLKRRKMRRTAPAIQRK
jgi:uncharacterized iron-regulated membrane protein